MGCINVARAEILWSGTAAFFQGWGRPGLTASKVGEDFSLDFMMTIFQPSQREWWEHLQ